MFQGNWKCSSCGGEITELPFQPRSESGLTCRTCYAKSRNNDQSASVATTGSVATPDEQEVPDDVSFEDSLATEPQADDGLNATAVSVGEKPRHEGDWTCSICGGSITSLPFLPRSTDNLKCIDCFKQGKS